MRIPDPPPFQTEIAELRAAEHRRDLVLAEPPELPPVSRMLESDAEARTLAHRIISAGRAKRAGPRHSVTLGRDRGAYGSRLLVTVAMRRDAWDLCSHLLGKTIPPHARVALAYAFGVDGLVGRRDRIDCMVQLKADALRRGRPVALDAIGRRCHLITELAAELGPVTGEQIRLLWLHESSTKDVDGKDGVPKQRHGDVLDERVERIVAFHGLGLEPNTAEWRKGWHRTVTHERDDIDVSDAPYIVGAMAGTRRAYIAGGSIRGTDRHHRAIAQHCGFLFVTGPAAVRNREAALQVAAAILTEGKGQL